MSAYASSASPAAAPPEVKAIEKPLVRVVIDGTAGNYSDVPIEIKGRVLLPFREILTRLGVPNDDRHIVWNEEEQSVTVYDGANVMKLTIGSGAISLNGEVKSFDVAPYFYHANNRTYVPVRAISEILDKYVMWEEATSTIFIRDKANYAETAELLAKMRIAGERRKIQASSESNVKMRLFMDGAPLPGADSAGFVNASLELSQLVTADLDDNVMHIKQVTTMEGTSIGTEMFMYGDKVYEKVEGAGFEWADVTGRAPANGSSALEQIKIVESQTSARSPTETAMGLRAVKGTDGTFSLVGEPVSVADVNIILGSLKDVFPQTPNLSYSMRFNKLQIGETINADLQPQKALVTAEYEITITESVAGGKPVKAYCIAEMSMNIAYDDVAPDFKVAIPADLRALIK